MLKRGSWEVLNYRGWGFMGGAGGGSWEVLKQEFMGGAELQRVGVHGRC